MRPGIALFPPFLTVVFLFPFAFAPMDCASATKNISPIYVRGLPLYPFTPCLFHNKLFSSPERAAASAG
jgi:hypothetical protein